MTTYRVTIDRSLCSGFGTCADARPGVFALDHSGIATLLVAESDDEGVLDAASSCPMGAIEVAETTAEAHVA